MQFCGKNKGFPTSMTSMIIDLRLNGYLDGTFRLNGYIFGCRELNASGFTCIYMLHVIYTLESLIEKYALLIRVKLFFSKVGGGKLNTGTLIWMNFSKSGRVMFLVSFM